MKTISAIALMSSLAIGSLIAGNPASAASLTLVTATPDTPGQVWLTIKGSGFDNATGGGDVQVTFVGTDLQFAGGTAGALFDTFAILDSGSQPATLGTPSPIRVDVFRSAAGNVGTGGTEFDVATLKFNVLPGFIAGTTTVELAQSLVGWFQPDATTQYAVDYGSLQVAAVPAPGALWLLATGVGVLVARRQLKAAA
jgi:hypothetical protein